MGIIFCIYESEIIHRYSKLTSILLVTLIAAHSAKTFVRNYDWLDEYSIFMSGLRVNDRNAKLFNNVGHALESQGKFKEALNFFNEAVHVQGDDIGAHINVGRTYNHLKMFKEAEDAYLKVMTMLSLKNIQSVYSPYKIDEAEKKFLARIRKIHFLQFF